jgi:WD40 repeat protein
MLDPHAISLARRVRLIHLALAAFVITAPLPGQQPSPGPAALASPRVVARLGDRTLWHGAAIRAVALSADERTLASHAADSQIALWDLASGKLRRRLAANLGATPVKIERISLTLLGPTLLLSADGSVVASMEAISRRAAVWDTTTAELLHQVPLPYTEDEVDPDAPAAALKRGIAGPFALTPDGTRLIFANAKGNVIAVIDRGQAEPVARLEGHEARILALAVAHDGKTLLSGGDDQTVRLWDLETGKALATFTGHRAPVLNVAFAPDDKRFLSASSDGMLFCRDRAGAILARCTWKPPHVQESPEGTLTTRQVQVNLLNAWFEPDDVIGCEFTILVGSTLSGAAQQAIVRWDAKTGKEKSRHTAHLAHAGLTSTGALALAAVARTPLAVPRTGVVAPTRRLLARASASHHIHLTALDRSDWVAPTSALQQTCADVEMAGEDVAIVRQQDHHVAIWNWKSGQIRPLIGHTGQPLLGGFTPSGKRLVTASQDPADRTVSLWDVATAQEIGQVAGWNPGILGTSTSISLLSRPAGVGSLRLPVLSPDGRLLALRHHDGKLRVVDTSTGKPVAGFAFAWKGEGAAAFSPDGKQLLVSDAVDQRRVLVLGGAAPPRESRGYLHLFDAAGKEVNPPHHAAYDFFIGRLAACGRFLLAGCKDGSIRVIDRATGRAVRDLLSPDKADPNEPVAILTGVNRTPFFVMAPDHSMLALRQADQKTVSIIEVATGQPRCQIVSEDGPVPCMGFAADGRYLVTGSQSGVVQVWDLYASAAAKVGDVEPLWNDLAGHDAARAFQAMLKLFADPAAALKLGDRLQSAAAPRADEVQRKLQELDSVVFTVRQKAHDELLSWGETVRGQLEKALQQPNLSGEVGIRLRTILKKLDEHTPAGQRLQELRMIELLSWLDSPQAVALLQRLTRDRETALAPLAQAVLDRREWRGK